MSVTHSPPRRCRPSRREGGRGLEEMVEAQNLGQRVPTPGPCSADHKAWVLWLLFFFFSPQSTWRLFRSDQERNFTALVSATVFLSVCVRGSQEPLLTQLVARLQRLSSLKPNKSNVIRRHTHTHTHIPTIAATTLTTTPNARTPTWA